MLLTAVIAVSAIAGASLDNEDKAYGELHGRIAERFRLWPGFAPHETTDNPGRYAFDERIKGWRRHDVSQPELVVFRPFGKPRDTMVVLMPGGGYQSQHMGHFCRDSRPILESGRWVALLHYRIPRREGRNIYDAPREDAARAIRILRANAARLGFSPEKIGAVGFSAGAHLAAISAVSSQDALYEKVDAIDDLSAHLNFAVPVYPAYVLDDGATGPNAHGGDSAAILPEFKFDAKTPPMFLVHGDKDHYSPIGSVRIYEELHRRKIPAQLFVYANVSHGLGNTPNAKGWQKRIVDWIESIGF
jgi:acetyl esterase/lipase